MQSGSHQRSQQAGGPVHKEGRVTTSSQHPAFPCQIACAAQRLLVHCKLLVECADERCRTTAILLGLARHIARKCPYHGVRQNKESRRYHLKAKYCPPWATSPFCRSTAVGWGHPAPALRHSPLSSATHSSWKVCILLSLDYTIICNWQTDGSKYTGLLAIVKMVD